MVSDTIRAAKVAKKPDVIKKYENTYKTPIDELISVGSDRNAYEAIVEKFVETAVHFQKDYPLTLLFSAVDDKDYTDMIRTILGKISFHHVIVTQVGGYRKVPAEKLAEIFREKGCPTAEACEDVEEAFKKALAAKGEDGMLFCVGSLYLVGEIKTLILQGVGK